MINNKKLILIIALVLLVILIIIWSLYFYFNANKYKNTQTRIHKNYLNIDKNKVIENPSKEDLKGLIEKVSSDEIAP